MGALPAPTAHEPRRSAGGRTPIFSGETLGLAASPPVTGPAWLAELRHQLAGTGPHLAWQAGDVREVIPIRDGFMRIGRSLRADGRVLEPTVSRRHALIHHDGSKSIVLDDHSLNGVYVNGKAVDWQPLEDGDELAVGAVRLHFIHLRSP